MTPDQVERIRRSFALVEGSADEAGALFYARLFQAEPMLRPLFIGDMREQGRKLIQMMAAAVKLLDEPAALLPVLARLGARHAGYGVVASDYRVVGRVLLDTLAQALGTQFDDRTREAWASMYALCSTTMQEAARAEHARQAA